MPKPLVDLPQTTLKNVRYVLTDFDDTLTLHGRLPTATLNALYRLEQAGVKVIPVTGGCAGWSDMMARVLPVAGVISEGGGVFLEPKSGVIHYHFLNAEAAMRTEQASLLATVQAELVRFPTLALAKDQAYRLTDVAIDYAQQVQPPAHQEKEALLALLREKGLNAKASSIHINVCQSGVDKVVMARHVLTHFFQLSMAQAHQQVIYVGDAPNDESMFAEFPLSVGVANIAPHLITLKHLPAYLTDAEGGEGFAQLADYLLCHQD